MHLSIADIFGESYKRNEDGYMEIKWNDENQEKMVVNKRGEVTYLSYESLDKLPEIRHGFSTRLGGVSQGIYSTMNLSFTRGDREENVRENYKRIAEAIGFSYESIVTSDQTHTTNVHVIKEEDRGNGITKPRPYTDVDGMITNCKGLTLATFYADCVPLYFVDPVHHAIGLSHSGWRGTVGKIGARTIEAMGREYGTCPRDLITAVGPSICQSCYEVSEDVILEFQKVFSEETWPVLFYRKPNGKYQLDLWKANEVILQEAGVPKEHISMPNLCTNCNPQILFSHRASEGKRGNLAAFLQLKEDGR